MNQPYKLIIADDEPIICRGLSSFPWDRLGYEVCGTACDGQECLELMKKDPADVIISDIQMPVMDGLTMTHILHERYPLCRVILLTGYKSFEYAQTAIKSDVVDYIVKPVDLQELENLMKTLRLQLDEKKLQDLRLKTYREKLDKSIPYAMEKFFNTLVFSHDLDLQELEERMALLEISFPYPYYVSASLQFTAAQQPFLSARMNQALSAMRTFKKEPSDETCKLYFFQHQETEIILLLNFDIPGEKTSTYEYVMDFIRSLYQYLQENMPAEQDSLTIGTGNIYHTIVSYAASYSHACEALKRKFFDSEHQLFFAWHERSTFVNTLMEYPYELENKLIDAVLVGKKEEALEYLALFHKECCLNPQYLTREYIQCTYQQFLLMTNRRLKVHGINLSDILNLPAPFSGFFEKCASLRTLQEKVKAMLCMTIEKVNEINNDLRSSSHLAVCQAMEYIHTHYSEKISLNQVAEYVHLNASYLSIQFKNEFGENFIDVLKEYRIEKARELLKNPDYKVYEICNMIGYTNPNYFTDTFKSQTGMTPLEYRKKFS